MDSQEIRKRFLKFFEERGHTIVPSSSLIPDDSSVLLTTAGMQQFKPYYTGQLDPKTTLHPNLGRPVGLNAVSVQKSFRTSDIDKVGDESHNTFFEMLGNFSFGEYFKKKAIQYGYDFITKNLGLDIDYVSVFRGDSEVSEDKESVETWKALGVSDIRKAGREDNFWGPTGKEGPCGPTTEIYVRDVEIWNIVFNEYYCNSDKSLRKLDTPGVDTGMGLERLVMALQKTPTIFETDLFKPILDLIFTKDIRIKRIIADHTRASVFLVVDGVLPSNVEQGYILRRLWRRVIRYAKKNNLDPTFYVPIVKAIVQLYKSQYRELIKKENDIITVLEGEIEKFSKALEAGEREHKRIFKTKDDVTSKKAFDLYQSRGLPLEITEDLLQERGLSFDRDKLHRGFDQLQVEHVRASSVAAHKKFGGHGLVLDTGELKAGSEREVGKITRLHTATHLLNQALNDVLGEGIEQRGSDINVERTRFDFSFDRKITAQELKMIEDKVNAKIKEDLPVIKKEIPRDEAFKIGARAFFKEKYPEQVSVYFIGDSDKGKVYSKELCGGPHVKNTREIGHFKILKEESSSAGVRRIRATVES